MASSTVKGLNVEITASLKGLTAGFKKAESKMKSFGGRVDKFGRSLRNTFSTIFAVGGSGAAIVAPFVAFESQMNRVKAITGLTGDEFDKVRKKALELGKTTELTATEAARGFVQLFKKGQSLTEALSGIDTVLGLVTAGELSAAEASKIASAAFKVFGKTGESFVSLGDKMAKASIKSGIDIKDFALLISKAGNTATNVGVEFSELSAAFGVLRDQAVEASEAATALRNIMQRASGRSAKALQELSRLKLDFFDDAGKFVGFAEAMERFNRATKDLNPQEIGDLSKVLFGSRAAGKALGLAGAAADIRKLKMEIDNSQGTLARFREELLKGLPGALRLMVSALETAAISISESFSKELELGADTIKDFALAIEKLSPGTKRILGNLAGIGGAVLLATVAVGTLIAAFKLVYGVAIIKGIAKLVWWIGTALVASFTSANVSAIRLGGTLKLLWGAVIAPILVFIKFVAIIAATFIGTIVVIEQFGDAMDSVMKAAFKLMVRVANFGLEAMRQALLKVTSLMLDMKGTGADKALKFLGTSAQEVANQTLGMSKQLLNIQNALVRTSNKVQKLKGAFGELSDDAKQTREVIAGFVEDLTGLDFGNLGKMFSGGDGDDGGGEGNKQNEMFIETTISALALKAAVKEVANEFVNLNEKIQGKNNGFSKFMEGIAKDLEKYKKTIGTVQEQVSKIIINSIQTMANGIGEIFAKVIVDGASFFKSAKDLMKAFARQFIKQIVAMVAQLLILAATQALVNNLTKTPVVGNAENQAALSSAGAFAAGLSGFISAVAGGLSGDFTAVGDQNNRRSFGTDFGNNVGPNQKKTTQTIILNLDGRQITKTVVENLPSVVRTGSGTIRST